jgi:hypothetical protein
MFVYGSISRKVLDSDLEMFYQRSCIFINRSGIRLNVEVMGEILRFLDSLHNIGIFICEPEDPNQIMTVEKEVIKYVDKKCKCKYNSGW